MTAETLMAVIIAATAGAVAGYILKHLQDNRWIREICNTYEETIEKINAEHKEENDRLMAYINRQQQREIARKMRENNPILKAADDIHKRMQEALNPRTDWLADFEDVFEPLPEPPAGWQDIDFGGNF
jgi:hypothetical protein